MSYENSKNTPILCAKRCGFFGDPETRNLCSKCYKDELLSSVNASIRKVVDAQEKKKRETMKTLTLEEESSDVKEKMPLKKVSNRCLVCKKKVGLTGFGCRCGGLFCSSHRYAEQHQCQYDFRSAGQNAIAKENPVVKANKFQAI